MKSPTHGSPHIAQSSKKRVFMGGSSSSSSGFKDVEVLETAPSSKIISKPTSSKKKKVVCEIIDLDLEEDHGDVLVIDKKADRKGKCKKTSSKDGSQSMSSNVDPEILRNFELFKKFDTVEDCSDNHFFATEKASNKPSKNWAKRIQEEWKILQNDLPDTIFVRVSESRMDLLRAVIVGAEGTPYHDGLFFFDICFPASYPNSPPKVYYHSGGLRINPNLYQCGRVCLSLLNTWNGQSKNEKWVPKVSTMLQVLVSIQGLILNVKPYFNEPGYESTSGTKSGEESSLRYNENTFIHSLQTMVYSMNRPPKYFEALVVGHYCKLARDILLSCKAYLEGVQVGCLVRGGVQDVDEGDQRCSENFKHRLAGFIITLIETFTRIGAKDCQEFHSLAQKVNGPATLNKKG
ncbi:putative ubiquitin-conjugating enzyme e2 38 [Phtheirospermum japonicum]|uniref:E2 ubiquitin-conjugating enzyme n=1 Tax=Phtheirospermum japonicum TaxID=374723 RepID=A0A830B6F3_9LAMI|nr:putative ubiquitin-conjugating enzyme e2 38 [Phtheirospermum japonicum]